MAKIYAGHRIRGEPRVWVIIDGSRSEPLPWRLDLDNHSPTGLEWGYAGSGPAQLALAILADATGDDRVARRLHQQFKFERITTLSKHNDWTMSQASVLAFVHNNADKLTDLDDELGSK